MDDNEPEDDDRETHGTATYSPEDNKLRIYPDGTRIDKVLSEAQYSSFKAAGYKWAGKQECFVCARWTPTAEDWALRLCGEIGDEDYSPEERSADRAERFGGYRDKRGDEAGARADAFEAGPAAFGHQSRGRAERQARRHDRHRLHAVSQWSKADYWQSRTEGVIRHALYKSSPEVRRGRIKTIETDQRKFLKEVAAAQARYDGWREVLGMEGADVVIPEGSEPGTWNAAQRRAYSLANDGHSWWTAEHPTSEAANAKAREIHKRAGFSAYDLLTRSEYIGLPFERLSPQQVAALYIKTLKNPAEQESFIRWAAHYELRLTYERAMIAQEGGTAAAVDMEPGGWIRAAETQRFSRLITVDGWAQVIRVNRSPATKQVTSVVCLGRDPFGYCDPVKQQQIREMQVNIERAGEDVYRSPTDDERAAFATATKERKAKAKAGKRPEPSLINPTDADAERLQAIWNTASRAAKCPPSSVLRMTQAEYSARSKGSYSSYETVDISERCERLRTSYVGDRGRDCLSVCIFKVRRGPCGNGLYSADRVIVLTDKPQKPIPWEAMDEARDARPTEETLFPKLSELMAAVSKNSLSDVDKAGRELIDEGRYVGWAYVSSQSQFGLTPEGYAAWRRHEEQAKAEPAPAGQLF